MAFHSFQLTETISLSPGAPPLVIAGPCVVEEEDFTLAIATELQQICADEGVSFVFKASADKANRTSFRGKRGPGFSEGLRVLAHIREALHVPVITDIHQPEQAAEAADSVDVLQIPAFLCRQTDLLLAAGKTGKPVNIKKGQFLHPEDMRFAAEKVRQGGTERVLLCERGTSFGYRDLVVDMRSLIMMHELGYPVIFDATHSVQSIGGAGGSSGGSRQFIAPLTRAAVSVGVSGVFLECHPQPESAPSDAKSMLPLSEMRSIIQSIRSLHTACQSLAKG